MVLHGGFLIAWYMFVLRGLLRLWSQLRSGELDMLRPARPDLFGLPIDAEKTGWWDHSLSGIIRLTKDNMHNYAQQTAVECIHLSQKAYVN